MNQGVIAAFKAFYFRQSLQEMIRQMETSGVSLKEYWKDYNIVKDIDNLKMTWEEVTVSCMKEMWHKRWPSNENCGTNYDNLDTLIIEISEIAEVGLDNVDSVGITDALESHSLPLSNELYDLPQQLAEQQKQDEDEEDRGTKEMQRKDFTDILSAIQSVPGVKVSTLGLNARADGESKTTYTYTQGLNSERFRSYDFLKYRK